MTEYRITAINDEHDACSCCGKTGLKRVVWLNDGSAYDMPFGTTCAAKKLRVATTGKAQIERKLDELLYAERQAERNRIFDELCIYQPTFNVYILRETNIRALAQEMNLQISGPQGTNREAWRQVVMRAVEIRKEKYPITN